MIFSVAAEGGDPVVLTTLGEWADSAAFSPDGTQMAFVSNEAGNNNVWLLDADGPNRTQVTTHEGSGKQVRWDSDGRGLYFSSDRNNGDTDIWFMGLASGESHQINHDMGIDITPAHSPDGTLIAFCSNRQLKADPNAPNADRDDDIWLMRADDSPCGSPDGTDILYTAGVTNDACHLRLVDVSAVCVAFATGDHNTVKEAAHRLAIPRLSITERR